MKERPGEQRHAHMLGVAERYPSDITDLVEAHWDALGLEPPQGA